VGNEARTPPEILVYGRNGGGPNTPGWSIRVVPNKFPALGIEGELDREGEGLFDNCWHYYDEKERCIFCDIIRQERDTGERVIGENEHFITLAPYAPRFPFEMWLLPKVHGSSYENNQSSVYASLARMLKDTLMRLDQVLDRPAFNFMIHTSPIGEEINDHYHWHIEIIPKLTKVAGFEWGTGFYINPTPPEESARFLREAKIPTVAEKK
jgi:UDPglucose--hexose-1-phosphate uridylyltransferase